MGESSAQYENMKVDGLFVVSQLECMGPYKEYAQKILADHGIVDPVPGQWYDAAAFLRVFDDMSQRFGSSTVFQIGKRTSELALFSPLIDSVEAGMIAFCSEYPRYHRGDQIGFITWTKTSERSGTMVVHNPYPCDWDRGAITTSGERFKRPGQLVRVVHDDTKPCRKRGGKECTYHVTW